MLSKTSRARAARPTGATSPSARAKSKAITVVGLGVLLAISGGLTQAGCFTLLDDGFSGGASDGAVGSDGGDSSSSSNDSGGNNNDSGITPLPDADTGPPSSQYVGAVKQDAPVLYLRLDEASFPANPVLPHVRDEIKGTLVGTRSGTLTPNVSGALANETKSKALQFDTGYLELGDRFAFSGLQPFSIELWVKSTGTNFSHVITKQDRGDPKNGWAILTNGGDISFERFVTNVGMNISASFPVSAFYNHVAAVYDGAQLRLYINGLLKGQKADARLMPNAISPLILATEQVGSSAIFQGALDEVALYDKALTEVQVQAHVAAAGQ